MPSLSLASRARPALNSQPPRLANKTSEKTALHVGPRALPTWRRLPGVLTGVFASSPSSGQHYLSPPTHAALSIARHALPLCGGRVLRRLSTVRRKAGAALP